MHYILAILAIFLAGCKAAPRNAPSAGPPPVAVSVAVAQRQTVPIEVRAVGTAEPFATVQVKSQIAGQLLNVRFAEGGHIHKGDLLFEIDPRIYQEALRQAQAAVAKDQALLRQAEANLARDRAQLRSAEADASRYEQLSNEGMAPRTQYEQMRANADALRESIRADQAAIEGARAALESDRAAVERAKLDLGYCEIRSPVEGRAGNLLVHPGNLVKANGDNALVVINQLEPIFVSFGVPEHYLTSIRQHSAARKLEVRASPSDGQAGVERGYLTVIDNAVDPNTGTIRLKAQFDNPSRRLWPGQFVNAVLTLDTQAGAVVIPAEAVQAGQRGQFVYVARKDQTVESRPVTVGQTLGNKVVVQSGVAAGETVVTDGQLRLFPGARIQPVAAAKIDAQSF